MFLIIHSILAYSLWLSQAPHRFVAGTFLKGIRPLFVSTAILHISATRVQR